MISIDTEGTTVFCTPLHGTGKFCNFFVKRKKIVFLSRWGMPSFYKQWCHRQMFDFAQLLADNLVSGGEKYPHLNQVVLFALSAEAVHVSYFSACVYADCWGAAELVRISPASAGGTAGAHLQDQHAQPSLRDGVSWDPAKLRRWTSLAEHPRGAHEGHRPQCLAISATPLREVSYTSTAQLQLQLSRKWGRKLLKT